MSVTHGWNPRPREAGETVAGIDIACPPNDIVRVSGHLIRGTIEAPADVYLLSNGSSVRTVTLDDRGGFTLRLRSGRYTLCATALPTTAGDIIDDLTIVIARQ
jgi:hypothetical protein